MKDLEKAEKIEEMNKSVLRILRELKTDYSDFDLKSIEMSITSISNELNRIRVKVVKGETDNNAPVKIYNDK